MVTLICLIAVVNLALGFGLALTMELWEVRKSVNSKLTTQAVVEVPAKNLEEVVPVAVPAAVPAVPAAVSPVPSPPPPLTRWPTQWDAVLQSNNVAPRSFIEAAAHAFRYQIDPYRHKLMEVQDRVTKRINGDNSESFADLLEAIRTANLEWLEIHGNAIQEFSLRKSTMGEFQDLGSELEILFTHQVSEIEYANGRLDSMYLELDQAAACSQLFREVSQLAGAASFLKDRMLNSLALILRPESRLSSLEDHVVTDEDTGLLNRIGCERAFENWRRDESKIRRPVSYVLLDVDQCASHNLSNGIRVVDVILATLGAIVEKECCASGKAVWVARTTGQSFAFLIENADAKEAAAMADRLRQTVKATTFDLLGTTLSVTVSGCVAGLVEDDSFPAVSARLSSVIREVKQGGRDRTAILETLNSDVQILAVPEVQASLQPVQL